MAVRVSSVYLSVVDLDSLSKSETLFQDLGGKNANTPFFLKVEKFHSTV